MRRKRTRWQRGMILGAQMTPLARDLAVKVLDRERRAAQARVLRDYDIGAIVLPVLCGEGIYGSEVEVQIAAWCDLPGGVKRLYELITFAREWDRRFVKLQLREPMKSQRYLETDHFLALGCFRGDFRRLRGWFDRVREECLTVRELRRAVHAETGQRRC